jgi:serine/threonine-protein kinase
MKWPFIALALVALALAGIAAFMSATAAEQVTVPAVVGQSVDDATARLERRGFQVTTTERHSSKPIGYVLGSDPARGAQADKGSTVTLIVSSGPAEVKVPSVTGFGESRAQKALAKLGLDSDTQTESSTEMEKGRVIRTEPAVGATVPAGERITLIVSSGPKEVQVPGVVGLTQSAAQRQLESLGLNVSVKETTSDKPAGEVIDQSPPDGAQAKEGDTVELTVSKGPEQVDVPDVLGLGVDDARASLRDAGFEVRVVEREVTDPAEEGQVIEQRPPANSKRPKGSAVTIVVGKAPAAGSGGTTPVPPVTTTPGTP